MEGMAHTKELDGIDFKTPDFRVVHLVQRALFEFVQLKLANNWSDIKGRIIDAQGREIGHETLTHFARNEKKGEPELTFYSTPTVRKAVAQFLCVNRYLSIEDLEAGEFDHGQTAARLADFFGTNDEKLCSGYTGTYRFNPEPDNLNPSRYQIEITLTKVDNLPIFYVSERNFPNMKERLDWESDDHTKPANTLIGWGVFQSKGVPLLYLRDSRASYSKMYLPISNPETSEGTHRLKSMRLYEQNELFKPSLVDPTVTFTSEAMSTMFSKVLLFQRVPDFSRKKRPNVDTIPDRGESTQEQSINDQKRNDRKTRHGRKLFFRDRSLKQSDKSEASEREKMKDEFEGLNEQQLGQQLWHAAKFLDEERARELIDHGAPVNHVDIGTGHTIIFLFGVYERWDMVQYLLDTGKCDLLIRNNQGRLLSTRIAEETGNQVWAAKIAELEIEQGRKVGIVPRINGDVPIEPTNEPD